MSKIASKVYLYVFYYENSNNILQRSIIDDYKIPVVVNVHYNGNISQNPRVKYSKYICRERNFII